jgi:molybdenum cofactor cytidylyltransferase
MFRLADQISGPLLVTTSTHLGVDQTTQVDKHYVIQTREDFSPLRGGLQDGVTLVTGGDGDRKRTGGLSLELLDELNDIAHSLDVPMLIEADGSRRKPMKAPAEHEPPIPGFVDTVIVLAGLSGLGQPMDNAWVHRPEIFERLSGLTIGETVTPQALVKVLTHPHGGLRNIPAGAHRIVLLNQADTEKSAANARGMVKALQKAYDVVIIGDMVQHQVEVMAAYVKAAGVVLAAGESKRLGTPKQLLEWEGKPFIRVAAEKALKAGLEPVVVVTGAHQNAVEQEIRDLEVDLVHNPKWKEGQSTSVRAGLNSLPEGVGAVIFFLVDQPKVPVNFIETLVDTHARTLAPILVPMVDHKRNNPVLFDQITFKDFSDIEGDAGGRQVFSRYQVTWVPWVDSSVFLDVDTMEDYQNLTE